jgi:hypothetical protein
MDQREQPGQATDEPLEELRGRIRATAEAAQRLAEDAGGQAGTRPPARGWEVPAQPAEPARTSELAELVVLVERTGSVLVQVTRGLVPVELRGQFAEALRDLLVALRALIDWYLERLGGAPGARAEVQVEDIPLD